MARDAFEKHASNVLLLDWLRIQILQGGPCVDVFDSDLISPIQRAALHQRMEKDEGSREDNSRAMHVAITRWTLHAWIQIRSCGLQAEGIVRLLWFCSFGFPP